MNVPELFYSGNYKQVLAATVDAPRSSYSDGDLSYVIGSLTFRGRLQEAETLYRLRAAKLCPISLYAARFYLGVGYTRVSDYAKARRYFGDNLRSGARHSQARIRFFAWQGLGFFRLSFGRYRSGYKAACKAFDAAVEDGFLYGKAIASDLIAHNQVLPGQISAALKSFDSAVEFARTLGDGGLVQAASVSRAIHSAQHGLDPKGDLARLEHLCSSIAQEDNYSKSRLLLEMTRQYTLRGDTQTAKSCLNQACQLIYSSRIRRYSILLNHRYAYLAYLAGDFVPALNLIQNANQELNLTVDRSLAYEVWDLERKILSKIGGSQVAEAKLSEALGKSLSLGRASNTRILARARGTKEGRTFYMDDPLGDLLDLCIERKEMAAQEIIASGYYGLFLKLIDEAIGRKLLYFDLVPGSLLLINHGQVRYLDKSASNIIRAIARVLSGGAERTKQELIESIWGYTYDPLRHDSTVYRNVSRFRAMLGDHADWLKATETGYQLDASVEVRFHEPKRMELTSLVPILAATAVPTAAVDGRSGGNPDLNIRQIKILQRLETMESIDPKSFSLELGVSEVTARRDFSDLCSKGLLSRVGKGRATRYVKSNGQPST